MRSVASGWRAGQPEVAGGVVQVRRALAVIAVIMRQDHVLDGLVGERFDLGHHVIVSPRVLGVHQDDSVIGQQHRDVAAPVSQRFQRDIRILDQLRIVLDLHEFRQRWRSLVLLAATALGVIDRCQSEQHDHRAEQTKTQTLV